MVLVVPCTLVGIDLQTQLRVHLHKYTLMLLENNILTQCSTCTHAGGIFRACSNECSMLKCRSRVGEER